MSESGNLLQFDEKEGESSEDQELLNDVSIDDQSLRKNGKVREEKPIFVEKEPSEIEFDKKERDLYHFKVKKIFNNILNLKEKMYEIRYFRDFGSIETMREELRKVVGEIRKQELDLTTIREDQYRYFAKSLKLNEKPIIKLPPPATSGTSSFTGNSRRRLSSFRKSSTSRPSLRIETPGGRSRSASQNWRTVMNVVGAAQTWKNKWEKTQIEKSEEALLSPVSHMTKEQILVVRKNVFRLKNKKNLTSKEKLLLETSMNRLKNLNKRFTDRKQKTFEETNSEF